MASDPKIWPGTGEKYFWGDYALRKKAQKQNCILAHELQPLLIAQNLKAEPILESS